MDETQKWYQSRSVLTGLVSVVAMVLTFLGIQFGPEDQEALLTGVLGAGGLVSAIASIWFRITAKKKIVT